jgi:membrane protease YdiL (CAAX protease family)
VGSELSSSLKTVNAILAAVIGVYLGLLRIWTGNLLTPVICHVVYDFAALVYFFKVHRSR